LAIIELVGNREKVGSDYIPTNDFNYEQNCYGTRINQPKKVINSPLAASNIVVSQYQKNFSFIYKFRPYLFLSSV